LEKPREDGTGSIVEMLANNGVTGEDMELMKNSF
jgi:hypothetical protein